MPSHLPSLPTFGMSKFRSCWWLHFLGLTTSHKEKLTSFSLLLPGFLFLSTPLLRKHLEIDYLVIVSDCLPFQRSHDQKGGCKEMGKEDCLVKFVILDLWIWSIYSSGLAAEGATEKQFALLYTKHQCPGFLLLLSIISPLEEDWVKGSWKEKQFSQ